MNGKVAIVTGGNSGIDYVVHPEATEALEREIVALGDAAIGVAADVSRIDELQKGVDAAAARLAL